MTEKLNELREQCVKHINEFNEALSKGDARAMNIADNALKGAEKDYIDESARVVYQECLATENPILEAVKRYCFPILSHKDNKENDIVIGRELREDRTRQIDLFKLCKYSVDSKAEKTLDCTWQYDVMKFNQLLCMRVAKDLGFTATQVKNIAKTYYMDDLARKIDLGETPDSNTQICKQLQQVVDRILFMPDDKGKNTIKVNNYDVGYLREAYAKMGKSALSIQVAKHDFMRRLIGNVLFRVVTNGKYSLEYKQVKAKK